ncbi:hypothetical protein FHR91_000474 [Erythrobacter lutimaris]|nr:hypothetical protein [Alteriqipengyuania lutimaris]
MAEALSYIVKKAQRDAMHIARPIPRWTPFFAAHGVARF